MKIAAIMSKELRSRMRGWRSPAIITAYLGLLGLLGIGFLALMESQMRYGGGGPPMMGLQLFSLLSGFQLGLVVFITPALTAGAVSSEREKQTLDLLLCTRLSSLSIVAGKLLSSLSYVLLLLLTSLPLFSLCFLFGGVSPRQLGLALLISLATAFTMGSIGVFLSTLIRRTQIATALSYAAAFGLIFGTSLAGTLMMVSQGPMSSPPPTPWVTYLNPMVALTSAVSSYGGGYYGGGITSIFVFAMGYYPGAPGTSPQIPLWQINLLAEAVIVLALLLLSAFLLRPHRWRGR